MSASISSEKLDIMNLSDSDISSDAEELQMLQKLRIDENALINNEKEMQNKIIQYEQKIRELQEELNSQGSNSELTRNKRENRLDDNVSNSFGSESSNSNRLQYISNVYNNEYGKNDMQYKNNNDFYFSHQTKHSRPYHSDVSGKYRSRLDFINEMEEFVNTKFSEAETILNSLLYSDHQSINTHPSKYYDIYEIQEQNIQLKSQLKQLKQSLYRYLNRHEAAKKKREAKESLLNQRIALLEEREKNLTQMISSQQKS